MLIEKWTEKDVDAVFECEKICFSDPWSREAILQTSLSDNFYGLTAKSGNRLVGYAGAIVAQDSADIALVATHPEFRRKKVAETLLNQLIAQLSSLGVINCFLEVRQSNSGARALYQKIGFTNVGIRKKYYSDTEDAIVMLKVLSSGTE